MAKFCGNCRDEVPESFKFCPECGAPVSQAPQTFSFEGVASHSLIQQIGSINIGHMNEEQFRALSDQLSQLLDRVGVPTEVSLEGDAAPLSQEARLVAQVVAEKEEEARRQFGGAVGDADMYLRLGNVAFNGKSYIEALLHYDMALALAPDAAVTWYNRGNALAGGLGRHRDALASYDKALALNPKFADAWTNRGITLGDLGRYNEALPNFDQALALKPAYAEVWSNRGGALWKLGRHQEAVASCDKALALKPDYAGAWYNRGLALDRLGRHLEAVESLKKADELRKKGT